MDVGPAGLWLPGEVCVPGDQGCSRSQQVVPIACFWSREVPLGLSRGAPTGRQRPGQGFSKQEFRSPGRNWVARQPLTPVALPQSWVQDLIFISSTRVMGIELLEGLRGRHPGIRNQSPELEEGVGV